MLLSKLALLTFVQPAACAGAVVEPAKNNMAGPVAKSVGLDLTGLKSFMLWAGKEDKNIL